MVELLDHLIWQFGAWRYYVALRFCVLLLDASTRVAAAMLVFHLDLSLPQ